MESLDLHLTESDMLREYRLFCLGVPSCVHVQLTDVDRFSLQNFFVADCFICLVSSCSLLCYWEGSSPGFSARIN
jgi:hypothetical protein